MAVSTETWHDRARAIQPETRAFIGGAYVDGLAGETFPSRSPRDGATIAHVAACRAEDVDRAVASARRAFEDGAWRDAHPRERKRVLHRLTDLLLEHRDELALLITLDMGKPIRDAVREVESSSRELRFFAEAVDKLPGEVAPTAPSAVGMMVREPAGVVGAITPWNFPLMMPIYKLAPALAMGNSVVLKPAEQAPLATVRLAALAVEAGLPDGVLNVVPGFGETAGEALARHMDVDVIAFTGSTEVGKRLLVCSGESNMKPVWLECGGKSPNIVLADAHDLDAAAATAAEAIFHGSGEVCNAGSRLLVEDAIHDELVERVLAHREAWRPDDPLLWDAATGPLVDATQLERVLSYVRVGETEGATLAAGGRRVREETGGAYMDPAVFVDARSDMRIAREEIFGPVLATMRLSSAQEAVAAANDSIYGLAAAVWTSDLTRAHRIARSLRAGSVYVNCYDRGDNSLPFGGFKQSGIGVDRSLHALEKYTRLKTIWIDLGA
jgi:gamma-glutamyl-gamma-aminobutyraldehyde dehydrogenase/4-guanidinobutyraldehyde dehydrogenase/NAD-dependent aldehyde dehydrogenase